MLKSQVDIAVKEQKLIRESIDPNFQLKLNAIDLWNQLRPCSVAQDQKECELQSKLLLTKQIQSKNRCQFLSGLKTVLTHFTTSGVCDPSQAFLDQVADELLEWSLAKPKQSIKHLQVWIDDLVHPFPVMIYDTLELLGVNPEQVLLSQEEKQEDLFPQDKTSRSIEIVKRLSRLPYDIQWLNWYALYWIYKNQLGFHMLTSSQEIARIIYNISLPLALRTLLLFGLLNNNNPSGGKKKRASSSRRSKSVSFATSSSSSTPLFVLLLFSSIAAVSGSAGEVIVRSGGGGPSVAIDTFRTPSVASNSVALTTQLGEVVENRFSEIQNYKGIGQSKLIAELRDDLTNSLAGYVTKRIGAVKIQAGETPVTSELVIATMAHQQAQNFADAKEHFHLLSVMFRGGGKPSGEKEQFLADKFIEAYTRRSIALDPQIADSLFTNDPRYEEVVQTRLDLIFGKINASANQYLKTGVSTEAEQQWRSILSNRDSELASIFNEHVFVSPGLLDIQQTLFQLQKLGQDAELFEFYQMIYEDGMAKQGTNLKKSLESRKLAYDAKIAQTTRQWQEAFGEFGIELYTLHSLNKVWGEAGTFGGAVEFEDSVRKTMSEAVDWMLKKNLITDLQAEHLNVKLNKQAQDFASRYYGVNRNVIQRALYFLSDWFWNLSRNQEQEVWNRIQRCFTGVEDITKCIITASFRSIAFAGIGTLAYVLYKVVKTLGKCGSKCSRRKSKATKEQA